jgi:hypothetical protein
MKHLGPPLQGDKQKGERGRKDVGRVRDGEGRGWEGRGGKGGETPWVFFAAVLDCFTKLREPRDMPT